MPCMHLNLRAANDAAGVNVKDLTTEYNGQKQSLDSLTKYYDASVMNITNESGNLTDVGSYTLDLNLTDPELTFVKENETVRTKSVNITITKKKIKMEAPLIDENGDLQDAAMAPIQQIGRAHV